MTSFLQAMDIFAGAGGLSLGAREAGIVVTHAIERDNKAANTYIANHPNVNLLQEDLGKIDVASVLRKYKLKKGMVDILMGGPPCQGFSIANLRTRNDENPNNYTYKYLLQITKALKPLAVVIENVAGIVTYNNGEVIKDIQKVLSRLGYKTSIVVLNAVEFSVPQYRKRVFIIAFRNVKHPFTLQIKKGKEITVGEALSDLPNISEGNTVDELEYIKEGVNLTQYQREMRLNNANTVTGCLTSKHKALTLKRFKCIKQGGNWEDIPNNLFSTYACPNNCHSWLFKRLQSDKPAVTISNFRKGMIIHPSQNRTLSIREAARLQSFPDWYQFSGNLQSMQQQVANAVPPRLAKKVLKAIKDIIS